MRHHALGEQRVERLDRLHGQMARLVHRAGEKARIQQMQDRMLDPADVLVHIHPIGGIFRIGRRRGMGRGEAGIVPGRIDKGIHRVRLALCRLAAGGASHVAPGRMTVQRIARLVEGDVIGQADRQVRLDLGHHAAPGAMHHRNRAAPIALAA